MKAYKGGKSSDKKENVDPNLLRAIQKLEKEEGRKSIPNESADKYSAMLLDLIKPYHADFPDIDEMEALLGLATIAWNMACMKKILPHAYKLMWQEAKDGFEGDKNSIQLLQKMVREKLKKYGEYDMFIHGTDIDHTPGGQFFVTATAKPMEAFLEDSFLEEEEEDGTDFIPGYINRNAFTVIPKKPFLDWKQNLEGNWFPSHETENTIYLLEEKESNEKIEAWLKKNFDKVFKKELEASFTDEKHWPKKRTYQMFREWFDISYQSMVYDLEDFPVDKDEG